MQLNPETEAQMEMTDIFTDKKRKASLKNLKFYMTVFFFYGSYLRSADIL